MTAVKYPVRCPACFMKFLGVTDEEARDHLKYGCTASDSEHYDLPTSYHLCSCGKLVDEDCQVCPFCAIELDGSEEVAAL